MHILFVTFFNLFMFQLQVDVVDPLLLNASLLPVLTTDYSDWLVQVDVVDPLLLNASTDDWLQRLISTGRRRRPIAVER